jgi:SAM-dependent methyltransferase
MIGRLTAALKVHGVSGVLGLLVQRVVPRRLSGHKQILELFRDRVGLEIGGPSPIFGPRGLAPIYPVAGRLDNCNFGARTMWEGDIEEGATFRYHPGRAPGRQYVAEATDLRQLPSGAYDFVLSSHALEHCANPLLALSEWVRVLKVGGFLLLVLPHRDATFDHRRPVTTLAHLIEDFDRRTTEADLTHLDEILRLHDLSRDEAAGDFEAFKARSLRNLENRGLHHHVFDTPLAVAMVDHMGLEVRHAEARRPMDIVVIARKPVAGAVRGPPPPWRSPFPSDRAGKQTSLGVDHQR